MDAVIPDDLRYCVFGYLDDLCFVSDSFENHVKVLVQIANQFKLANLTLNENKSKFCARQANYLGYIIGNGGIATDPQNIESIRKSPFILLNL